MYVPGVLPAPQVELQVILPGDDPGDPASLAETADKSTESYDSMLQQQFLGGFHV